MSSSFQLKGDFSSITEPHIKLNLRSIIPRALSFPIPSGILPVKLLSERFKMRSKERLLRDDERLPCNRKGHVIW